MPKVFYLHWNEQELKARIAPLAKAGFEVHGHWSTEDHARFGDGLPEVAVISLDRLPSHGNAVAEWFWEAQYRRAIPLVFAGGNPEKVDTIRAKFAEAHFCSADDVPSVVARLIGEQD